MTVRKWFKIAAVCASLMATAGCGNGPFVTVPDPLNGPPSGNQSNPSGTSSQPSAPQHVSHAVGIGDTLAWMNSHWGKPSRIATPIDSRGTGDVYYRHNQVYVRYNNHRAYAIDDMLTKPVSIAAAKTLAKGLIPADSEYQATILNKASHTDIDRYSSRSIQTLWPPEVSGGLVGTLSVQFTLNSKGKVEEVYVTVGETLYAST